MDAEQVVGAEARGTEGLCVSALGRLSESGCCLELWSRCVATGTGVTALQHLTAAAGRDLSLFALGRVGEIQGSQESPREWKEARGVPPKPGRKLAAE